MEILEKPSNLTTGQEQLYDVMVERAQNNTGCTVQDLMESLEIRNPSVIYSRLQHLQDKGAIAGYIDPSRKTQAA